MTADYYYKVLEIDPGSSIDDIKRAYRKKARLYHPDLNHDADAPDLFILVTEAYEFLISNFHRLNGFDQEYNQTMEDWRKYRQDRSRQRARAYSRASYLRFKKTKFYRTTRILDGTTIIFSLIVSTVMIIYTIVGYLYRLAHPLPETENPTFFTFLMLLVLGMLFFTLSVVYLKVHIESSRKRKKKRDMA